MNSRLKEFDHACRYCYQVFRLASTYLQYLIFFLALRASTDSLPLALSCFCPTILFTAPIWSGFPGSADIPPFSPSPSRSIPGVGWRRHPDLLLFGPVLGRPHHARVLQQVLQQLLQGRRRGRGGSQGRGGLASIVAAWSSKSTYGTFLIVSVWWYLQTTSCQTTFLHI